MWRAVAKELTQSCSCKRTLEGEISEVEATGLVVAVEMAVRADEEESTGNKACPMISTRQTLVFSLSASPMAVIPSAAKRWLSRNETEVMLSSFLIKAAAKLNASEGVVSGAHTIRIPTKKVHSQPTSDPMNNSQRKDIRLCEPVSWGEEG